MGSRERIHPHIQPNSFKELSTTKVQATPGKVTVTATTTRAKMATSPTNSQLEIPAHPPHPSPPPAQKIADRSVRYLKAIAVATRSNRKLTTNQPSHHKPQNRTHCKYIAAAPSPPPMRRKQVWGTIRYVQTFTMRNEHLLWHDIHQCPALTW